MQKIAADVGFSETAFAVQAGADWRVRYFSPESEVPFCGHATIALGAALALQQGDGVFSLQLNQAKITVEGRRDGSTISAALQSPHASPQVLANLNALDSDAFTKKNMAVYGVTDKVTPNKKTAFVY